MRSAVYVFLVAALFVLAGPAMAEEVVVQMNLINDKGVGAAIGTVTLADTPGGLSLSPSLNGLAAGNHGFHVHEKPDCGAGTKDGKTVPGLAAGGHFDPAGHRQA